MRTKMLKRIVVAVLLVIVAGCSIQPGPEYYPPTAEQIIRRAETDEGKQLREGLRPALEALLGEIEESEVLKTLDLKEDSVGLVRFEESGSKRGLEFVLDGACVRGATPEQTAWNTVARYLPALADLIGRYPSLIDSSDLDCFVVGFRWIEPRDPAVSYRTVKGVSIVPGTGQIFDTSHSVPNVSSLEGGLIYQDITLDIPRLIMKKLALSEIGARDIRKYAKEAGPRKPM
jgi:predicted small lipoprotein YifL